MSERAVQLDTDDLSALRAAIRARTLTEEAPLVRELAEAAALSAEDRAAISDHAARLVRQVRKSGKPGMMESFLAEYGLSTEEGVALMCLAEAMLRVPDARTVDDLIRDKITPHDWASHIGDSGSIMVNASTWALMLTGRVLEDEGRGIVGTLHGMVRRLGEPVVRRAVGQAMAEMGSQFVLGRTIIEAMDRGREMTAKGYTYSYDMLGEAARTEGDARRYHDSYAQAITTIAKAAKRGDIRDNPGISVKLSALHPRYEATQAERMVPVLADRLLTLAQAAAVAGIGFNIDAEEADRLDVSLDVIARVLGDKSLADWGGFGVVVQAFGRRMAPTLDWIHALAEAKDRRVMVRLVKGAYWDTEIKRAQVMGLADYPVFTRKPHTDVSYLAGARQLLGMTDRIYPQFATHNAHTVAAVLHMAEGRDGFEFQRLHGMGEALHEAVRRSEKTRCRIYAPVGAHKDLLAYLVRRLLENGANSSFVNQIVDEDVPAEEIARDPIALADAGGFGPNPVIPRPADMFAPRANSRGWDLTDPQDLAAIEAGRARFAAPHRWQAGPLSPAGSDGTTRVVTNPARPDEQVGTVKEADADLARAAIGAALDAQPDWQSLGMAARAAIMRRAAEIYEENAHEIFALCTREAGKTLPDAVAELREAVDFLRYYADEAEAQEDGRAARGVIVCISPWNFPLAIFTGQIAAALAAGNSVIAKPAEQTALIAHRAVEWLHAAGVPAGALHLLPGDGPGVGAPLTADPRIGGVCFTGSTEVAKAIDRQLAQTAPEAMLIAETGGLNAMIVDSTALLEQATRDILRGAFQSAGQRCSALRMLYVQREVAEPLLEMVRGAMASLVAGDPWDVATDVGPVIDAEAQQGIREYLVAQADRVKHREKVPETGLFVPPAIVEVAGIADVEREIFGPVLHVARFDAAKIEDVVHDINARGYGLTFGLHTRIDRRVQRVLDRIEAGNVYVNRDQIGAIVGSQPFGGHGLSGTGPKAGGPHYLPQFLAPQGRPAGAQMPDDAETVTADDAAAALATLDGRAWAVAPDRIARLRGVLRGKAGAAMRAAAGLETGPVDLPGPTGESNQYELRPRGTVLCLGPGEEVLLAQVVQALAAGNRVLAVAPGAQATLATLVRAGIPVATRDGALSPDALTALEIDAVAACASGAGHAALRRALAARDGPILPLITAVYAPAAYVLERAICIDTTAAGGNASLLAAAE